MLSRARRLIRIIVTLLLLVGAVVSGIFIWNHYLIGPWTRDGEVRANVVRIAPEISGRILAVKVADNQLVKKGDVLYEIEPVDYEVAVAQADADVRSKKASWDVQRAQAERRVKLSTTSVSEEQKQIYIANADEAHAAYDSAVANLRQARVNLERTTVRSPVNGHVTNLLVQSGDYAAKGSSNITLIDSDSLWVVAYFEETKLHGIHVGDTARIDLMGVDTPLSGHVESIARGINSPNYAPGTLGLPSVNPVFTWVRLAQRIPVHIRIDSVPDGLLLAAGETATVNVGPLATDKVGGTHGLIGRMFSW